MSQSGIAPTRQVAIEPPGRDFADPCDLTSSSEAGEKSVIALRLLWADRGLLSRVVLYFMFVSTPVVFLIPSRYESTTRLMPPEPPSGSGLAIAAAMSGGSGQLGGMASDFLGVKSTSDIFVGILTSRTAEDVLIQRFALQKLYRDSRVSDARKDLAARTAVSVDRKSQIISVTVTDGSPERAASMSQAYVDELNHLSAELSTSSARRERIFLEERLQSVNQDLEAAEREFSEFASKNTAIDIKAQGTAMVESAATIQGQLIAAQSQYEGLKEIYTDKYASVRTLKARIDELRRQLEKLGGKGESTTTVSAEPSQSMYPSIRKLPLLGVAYADLYRRTKIEEAVLETLTKEYELAKVQEAKEIPTVKVLDAGLVPDSKSYPPRALFIFAGMTLAFTAGVLWVFAKSWWNQMGATDSRKVLVQEIFSTLAARMPTFWKNGSGDKHSGDYTSWS